MFWFFKRKREMEELRQSVKDSFNSVKKDFSKVGEWIEYIDEEQKTQKNMVSDLKEQISELQEELEGLKSALPFFERGINKQLSKQAQTVFNKQTAVEGIQTAVQTAVQTGILSGFTITERAIVWALLNSDMKLSYEDIAAVLGKDKSTIRGQINSLKRKSEGLVEEITEANGKKRLFIPENMKNIVLKTVKVRVNKRGKSKKNSEN